MKSVTKMDDKDNKTDNGYSSNNEREKRKLCHNYIIKLITDDSEVVRMG